MMRAPFSNVRTSRFFPIVPILSLLGLLLGFGPTAGQNLPEVDLTGTVADANGAALKNAKVTLLGRKLTTLTDAGGKFTIRILPTAVRGAGAERLLSGSALEAEPGSEPGSVPGPEFRSLDGRVVGPDLRNAAPVFGFPWATSRVSAGAAAKTGPIATDTLSVVAMGFERGERALLALTGTQDFKLGALKYTDVLYKQGDLSAAEKSSCLLDVHKPPTGNAGVTKWPVVIHFHGGGMVEGDKTEGWTSYHNNFAWKFLDAGYLMVMPNYRLIGKGGTWPGYLQDAAAAASWVRKNIEPYGGDPDNVFISGWSAGAYLTQMLLLDTTWFAQAGYDAHYFRGFIALSSQTKAHSNLQADLKVANIMAEKPYAMPMGHIRKTDIPFQIFVGGLEGGTITDNQDLYNQLVKAGSKDLAINVIAGHAHNDMGNMMGNAVDETRTRFLEFLAKYRTK
jgi:alpha/beta superfamily hydrolase